MSTTSQHLAKAVPACLGTRCVSAQSRHALGLVTMSGPTLSPVVLLCCARQCCRGRMGGAASAHREEGDNASARVCKWRAAAPPRARRRSTETSCSSSSGRTPKEGVAGGRVQSGQQRGSRSEGKCTHTPSSPSPRYPQPRCTYPRTACVQAGRATRACAAGRAHAERESGTRVSVTRRRAHVLQQLRLGRSWTLWSRRALSQSSLMRVFTRLRSGSTRTHTRTQRTRRVTCPTAKKCAFASGSALLSAPSPRSTQRRPR
jgi:hypothetical protein